MLDTYDCVVVGGGPSGATAATDLARQGHRVLLADKAGRIKPCGGAIPPRLIRDFDIPDRLLVAKISSARMVSPAGRAVDMPIDQGFVGMVDRDVFDPWLRERAGTCGAEVVEASYTHLTREPDGTAVVHFEPKSGPAFAVRAKMIIGADGAVSRVGRAEVPGGDKSRFVFAYHEIIAAPEPGSTGTQANRCDVYYQGQLSPDFYAWIFPHGGTYSVGVGSAHKGFSLKSAVADLRHTTGLEGARTVRREGAPIPLKPLNRWDNGRDIVLAGDAAGVVAPASGEGIYYAMVGGRLAAEAVHLALVTGDARQLAHARRSFMRQHGRVFWVLGLLQHFWYSSDKRRERFVSMCADADVQRLTWQAYMNKELVRSDPLAHVRIFIKDTLHLFGLVAPR